MKLVERQVIVCWNKPEEKLPEDGIFVIVTMSGHAGNIHYDHTFAIAEYWSDDDEWDLHGMDLKADSYVVHAWADLEPYMGD